jgi:type IV pilus assembly protein PilA
VTGGPNFINIFHGLSDIKGAERYRSAPQAWLLLNEVRRHNREDTMKRVQQGFTLIELMIVVAIVGILAAIALPAYQDYIVRSKMSEGEAAAAACKTSVSEYSAVKNAFPTTVAASGCSTTATQYVASLAVGAGGVITVTTQNTGTANCNLVLTPGGTPTSITSWSGSTTCPTKYTPSSFR